MRKSLALSALGALGALTLTACVVYEQPRRVVVASPPPVVVAEPAPVVVTQGPPPWAPARGYRNKNRYVYYYHEQVYYNVDRREYCWLDGGRWRVGVTLPGSIHLSVGGGVSIDLEGPRPEVYHTQVIRTYPPTYVVIHEGPRGGGPGRGGPGRGNGPGRGDGPGRGRGR